MNPVTRSQYPSQTKEKEKQNDIAQPDNYLSLILETQI
jgi:hypothetical protein